MPEGLFTLLLFSFLMAIASFGAGMLPLAVSLSPSQLRLISTVGMGVLVGTSLIVIIPEGIDTIYSAKVASAPSTMSGPMLRGRSAAPASWSEYAANLSPHHPHQLRNAEAVEIPDTKTHTTTTTTPHGHGHEHEHDSLKPTHPEPEHDDEHDGEHEHTTESAHKWVGLSLISGFILMYLIDVLPHQTHKHNPQPYHIEIDNLRSLSASSSPLNSPSSSSTHAYSKTSSTTLGLVIHAAADGIALGASSTSSNAALEAIVFLAIMLHKAPAAFGLSAVLLRAGLGKRQARAHLIVFSLAAPVGAIVTWVLLGLLGEGTGEGMQWWTGMLLLFSGGTFLYVAMHTMQDQSEIESGNNGNGNSAQKPGMKDTLAAVVGMLLPLATQIGHHHH
ncbi:Zinc/iron permease [Choiromyces venosus 120613-1]|uniref:Zinc/iron permease n=1 Tax=Choiromyces venosus 120613-1 TaxID=1336337 RepID=A0A3N4JUY6_9PEZI|nr:Zinc/iron permease [Choiromyces venosus 120613-1]